MKFTMLLWKWRFRNGINYMLCVLEDTLVYKKVYIQAGSYVEAKFFVQAKLNDFSENLKNYLDGKSDQPIFEVCKMYLSDDVFIDFKAHTLISLESLMSCIKEGPNTEYEFFPEFRLYPVHDNEMIFL